MTTPAGWYPDPDGTGGQRYWDGSAWTEHRAVGAPAAVAGQTGASGSPTSGSWFSRHKGLTVAGGAVLALLVVTGVAGIAGGGNQQASAPGTSSAVVTPSSPAATEAPTGARPTSPATTTPATTTPATTTPATTAPPKATSTPPAPAAPATAISGDGTFVVPGEVRPGTYTAPDATDGCYWARLKGTSGELDDILANDNAAGPTIVTIGKGDKAFETRGCGNWVAGTPRVGSSVSRIEPGAWAVRVSVAPGTYRTSGGSGCYWARLRDFSGTLDGIIANDNVSGRGTVTIAASDAGFTTNGCATWVRLG